MTLSNLVLRLVGWTGYLAVYYLGVYRGGHSVGFVAFLVGIVLFALAAGVSSSAWEKHGRRQAEEKIGAAAAKGYIQGLMAASRRQSASEDGS